MEPKSKRIILNRIKISLIKNNINEYNELLNSKIIGFNDIIYIFKQNLSHLKLPFITSFIFHKSFQNQFSLNNKHFISFTRKNIFNIFFILFELKDNNIIQSLSESIFGSSKKILIKDIIYLIFEYYSQQLSINIYLKLNNELKAVFNEYYHPLDKHFIAVTEVFYKLEKF